MNKFVITKNYLNGSNHDYICILFDFVFWGNHIDELRSWCVDHGCSCEGMTVMIPDDETVTLFALRWM